MEDTTGRVWGQLRATYSVGIIAGLRVVRGGRRLAAQLAMLRA